jgi:hypothetical protein
MSSSLPREGETGRTPDAPPGKPRGSLGWLWGIPVGVLFAAAFLAAWKLLNPGADNVEDFAAASLGAQMKDSIASLDSEITAYDLALDSLNCPPRDEEIPTGEDASTDEADLSGGLSGGFTGELFAEADIPAADPNPSIFVAIPEPTPPPVAPPPAKTPAKETPKAPAKTPAKEPAKTPAKEPAKTPAKEPAAKGPPSELKTVSDLYGCWTSRSGVLSALSGSSMYHYYCFDKSGNAVSYSASLKNGKVRSECKARATAKLSGSGFTISESAVVCPGWESGVYSCKLTSPGAVRCSFRLNSGKTDSIDFKYRGETL